MKSSSRYDGRYFETQDGGQATCPQRLKSGETCCPVSLRLDSASAHITTGVIERLRHEMASRLSSCGDPHGCLARTHVKFLEDLDARIFVTMSLRLMPLTYDGNEWMGGSSFRLLLGARR